MIHFLPDTFVTDAPAPHSDAAARLASIRTALGVAEQVAQLPVTVQDGSPGERAWPKMSEARRRCFERRSIESAQAAAAGLEVIAAERDCGGDANRNAVERLALALRSDLAGLDRLFSL